MLAWVSHKQTRVLRADDLSSMFQVKGEETYQEMLLEGYGAIQSVFLTEAMSRTSPFLRSDTGKSLFCPFSLALGREALL